MLSSTAEAAITAAELHHGRALILHTLEILLLHLPRTLDTYDVGLKGCVWVTVGPICRQVDSGMKLSLWLAAMTLTTSCVLMFLLVLDGDAFQDHSLAVLNAFVSYPVFAYGIFSVFQVMISKNEVLCRRRVLSPMKLHATATV